MSKTQEDIIEYARPRTTDPNTLVSGGETPPNEDYLPPNGSVCIRQEDIWGDGRDVTIYFTPKHAEKIANAIMALAERPE